MRSHSEQQDALKASLSLRKQPDVVPLQCGVRHYEWGGSDAIPALLGVTNEQNRPFAELWIGAHPELPAKAKIAETEIALDTLIGAAPDAILGREITERFAGRLPFLLKILSARKPLSIQVHPDKKQAEQGFERENRLGLAPGDPRRDYKDDNHKPELIVALTDFYALRGFCPLTDIAALLASTPELKALAIGFQTSHDGLAALYEHLMHLPPADIDALLDPLIERLRAEHQGRPFGKHQAPYWLLGADAEFSRDGHRDRGLLSVLLLNLVYLRPGQAMYLPAGELHAYLEGTGVELMANSDNLLRGGLTPKRVNIDELLRILNFSSGEPRILSAQATSDGVEVYQTPAPEFELSRLYFDAGQRREVNSEHGVQLAIVTDGGVDINAHGREPYHFPRGSTYLIPRGLAYTVSSSAGAVLYQASVPRPLQADR